MNKPIWSIVLFCVIILSFVLSVLIGVNTAVAISQMENLDTDTSNGRLPGASILGVMFVYIALWSASLLLLGAIASVGWICSFVNTKIASDRIIKSISYVFLIFYSVVVLLIVAILAYFMIWII